MLRRSPTQRAEQLTARAAALIERDRRQAERLYRQAVALDPDLHQAWFDLGLICKWERRWDEAFHCNLRAAELLGDQADEPAWWNLGIAATALRRWDTARRAWAAYGVSLAPGAGPIEADLGLGPVRLNPAGEGEVVWGHRIDPARIRIMSIPFPQSGHRWSDVVLHDGVPNGYRQFDGQSRPVFDELERWEPSDVPTVSVSVHAEDAADVDELMATVEAAGFAAENWSTNVRWLCRQCSEGSPHRGHAEEELEGGEHFLGLAAPRALVDDLLEGWQQAPGRAVHAIEEATG